MTATPEIDRLLAEARAGLRRVSATDLPALMAAGALVIDTRPVEQRRRNGDLPGAVVVDRNVLEWRLDPTSPSRLPIAVDKERIVVVVCNEGFSSSLAAATLQRLGLLRATDLIGGFQEWSRTFGGLSGGARAVSADGHCLGGSRSERDGWGCREAGDR